MTFIRLKGWVIAASLLIGMAAQAADIDLFTGGNPTGSLAPEVLFVIDTGASFGARNDAFHCNISDSGTIRIDATYADKTQLDSTNGGVEQCALYSLVKSLEKGT